MTTDAGGFDLAPGETLVPGSVQTVEAADSSSDAAPAAEAGDAPPAPKPDANTDV
jgi:hypothetical protein